MEMARSRSITTGWLIGRKRQFRSRSLRTIIVSLGAGTESQKGKTDRAEGPGPSRAAGQRSRRSEPAADKAAQAVHRERPIADFGRLDRAIVLQRLDARPGAVEFLQVKRMRCATGNFSGWRPITFASVKLEKTQLAPDS